jgi:hypothetical protein
MSDQGDTISITAIILITVMTIIVFAIYTIYICYVAFTLNLLISEREVNLRTAFAEENHLEKTITSEFDFIMIEVE